MTAAPQFGDDPYDRDATGDDDAVPDPVRRMAERLWEDPRANGQHISVQIQDGVIILEGVVDTTAAADAVIEAVTGVDGVREVCNLLRLADGPATRDAQHPFAGFATDHEFETITDHLRRHP